jgi:hypothetical protein
MLPYCAEDTGNSAHKRSPVLLSATDIRGSRVVYIREWCTEDIPVARTASCSSDAEHQRGMLVSDSYPFGIQRIFSRPFRRRRQILGSQFWWVLVAHFGSKDSSTAFVACERHRDERDAIAVTATADARR